MDASTPAFYTDRSRIVLVDDDPGVRRSIQFLLQANGYDVRSYASASALLADPATRTAACFVTDYRMTEMDGLTLLRALRADGWRGPAILVTAYHSPDLAKRALAEGFSSVIEKPLREHVLLDAVARLVHRK